MTGIKPNDNKEGEGRNIIKKFKYRNKKKKKRGRLVIRNLNYKVTEEKLREYFQTYGSITELSVLKYPDGRLKGVAFLEYDKILSALKAIKEFNLKPFMGRPIAVDLAVQKQRYQEHKGVPVEKKLPDLPASHCFQDNQIKSEVIDDSQCNSTIDSETGSCRMVQAIKIKEEPMEYEGDKAKHITDNKANEKHSTSANKNHGEQNSEDEDEYSEDDDDEKDDAATVKSDFVHNPVSKDVLEGKTLFIRNLSFDSAEDKIQEILSEFGELKYVMFCKDRVTQRHRGSAFAQFMSKEDCDACLEAYEDPAQRSMFVVDGRTLSLARALGREEVGKKSEETKKEKEKKDKRNLYLAREGVIREGTKAGLGVSKSDLMLRTHREIMKRKMLENFNIYVSPNRLCIHNLPLTLNDSELLVIVKKNSPNNAAITECRIMRNLFELDDGGKPKSKGFAFVTFKEHGHALAALRNMNNNPSVFSAKQRPVIEFSLENKAALKAKENRLKKSISGNVKAKKEGDFEPMKGQATMEDSAFMGSKYNPQKKGMAALSTHIGPKIRHRDSKKKGKITRNQINNQLRNENRGKKRKRGKKGGPPSKKAKKTKKQKKIRA